MIAYDVRQSDQLWQQPSKQYSSHDVQRLCLTYYCSHDVQRFCVGLLMTTGVCKNRTCTRVDSTAHVDKLARLWVMRGLRVIILATRSIVTHCDCSTADCIRCLVRPTPSGLASLDRSPAKCIHDIACQTCRRGKEKRCRTRRGGCLYTTRRAHCFLRSCTRERTCIHKEQRAPITTAQRRCTYANMRAPTQAGSQARANARSLMIKHHS